MEALLEVRKPDLCVQHPIINRGLMVLHCSAPISSSLCVSAIYAWYLPVSSAQTPCNALNILHFLLPHSRLPAPTNEAATSTTAHPGRPHRALDVSVPLQCPCTPRRRSRDPSRLCLAQLRECGAQFWKARHESACRVCERHHGLYTAAALMTGRTFGVLSERR